MKNSSDTIGNRTRDLLACSAVPQPTAPPHALPVLTALGYMPNNLVIMLCSAYSLLIYQTALILNLLMTKLHVVYNYVAILGDSVTPSSGRRLP
jgi:hypothetical protein